MNFPAPGQFQFHDEQGIEQRMLREDATDALIIVLNLFPDICCISLPENLCMRISIMTSENQIYSLDLNSDLSYYLFREFGDMKTIVLKDSINEQLHVRKLLLRRTNLIQYGENAMNDGIKADSVDSVVFLRPTVFQILKSFSEKNRSYCKMECDQHHNAIIKVYNNTCTYTIDLTEDLQYIIQADINAEDNQQNPIEGKISNTNHITAFLYKVSHCLPAQGSTPFIGYLFTC